MIARDRIEKALRAACGDSVLALEQGLGQEYYCVIDAKHLLAAVEALTRQKGWHHLSAITVVVNADRIEVLYHLWMDGGLTLRASLPLEGATLPSLTGLFPIAAWYEREIHDLAGVAFLGNPNLSPLLLPEGWRGPPPLLQQDEAPSEDAP